MKKKTASSLPRVTIVIPMRNAQSTIIHALESIRTHDYPIEEVIVVDNASQDESVKTVHEYAKKNPKIKLRLLVNSVDLMVARSFNRGIRGAKTPYVILMHADCRFSSDGELRRLIDPIIRDPSVIATYGVNETPLSVWKEYSFWEKCLLSRDVGKAVPGLVGKIDCYNRQTLLKAGGFDEIHYANFGGEDADLHLRLKKIGRIVATKAKTLHLHYLYKDFSLPDLLRKKRATARTYGRLLRVQGIHNGPKGIFAMLFKPLLAIGVFIPGIRIFALPVLILFPFWYYQCMFTTTSTLKDPRILILPIIGIVFVYYEAYWTIEAFLQNVEK